MVRLQSLPVLPRQILVTEQKV